MKSIACMVSWLLMHRTRSETPLRAFSFIHAH